MQEENADDFKDKLEQEARLFAEAEEGTSVEEVKQPQATVTSLGKAEKFKTYDDEPLAMEIGWKNIPSENLPSQGLFYEAGTQIAIRAAAVAEIRHWSTIDDNDLLSIDEMLNFIIEKCCRIKVPGKPGTYKDLKEIDRFYLIFAIRDYTFKNGENKIFVNASDEEGVEEKIEVTKDLIDYFNPDERLMNYYERDTQSFHIRMKNGEEFHLYLPTLGAMLFIKNFLKARQQSGQHIDKAFTKYAPFLFPDWKGLTQTVYEKAVRESYSWSFEKISVLDKIVELLSSSVNPQIRYINSAGGEATAPLNFPGGFKSLFLISDIFGELV